jgi:hypothetical protein
MKHFKYAAIVAAALAIPTLAAIAQPWGGGWGSGMMGPYGYGPGMMGPYGYGPGMMGPYGNGPGYGYGGPQVDAAKVDAAAKLALSKATAGKSWTNPAGITLTPILVDNQIVGQLWQSADLKAVEIGSYADGPWGVRVQLLKDGQIVGMLWVKVS